MRSHGASFLVWIGVQIQDIRRPDRTADPVPVRLESQRVLSISTTDGSHPMTGTSRSRIRSRRNRNRNRHGNGICHRNRRICRRTCRRICRSRIW